MAMIVAGYVRQSDSHGRRGQENISPLQQQEAFRHLCALHGWELGYLTEDIDFSGFRIAYTQRPGLMKLLDLASQGAFQKLLVYRWTRISRRTQEFLEIIEAFRSYGVGVKSVMEEGLDTESPVGKLMLTIQAGFAQYQSEDLSEYITHAQRLMVEQGRWRGGRCPYGYQNRDGLLTPHQEEAPWVRQIFAWFAADLGTHQIAEILTTQGVPSPGGKALWRSPTVRKILKNPTYQGYFPFRGQIFPAPHPPLVEKALWDQVQKKLEQGQRHPRRIYPLSGLIRCQHCDLPLIAIKTANLDGHHRYICPNRRRKTASCPQKPLDGPSLERLVQEHLPRLAPLSRLELQGLGLSLKACGTEVQLKQNSKTQSIQGTLHRRVIRFDPVECGRF